MTIVLILFVGWAAAVSVILLFKKLLEKPVLATSEDMEQICRRLTPVIDKLDIDNHRVTYSVVEDCRDQLLGLRNDLGRAIARRKANGAE